MDSPINKIDELLSGMLDGVLSEAESSELGREMANNPSLEGRLDELATIRKSLMSGRSTKTLRPDFASSVTTEAKKRAAEMGPDGPEWLLANGDSRRKFNKNWAPMAAFQWPSSRWVFASVLSLAALFAFAFFVFQKPDIQSLVSVPKVESPELPESHDPTTLAVNAPGADSAFSESAKDLLNERTTELAENKTPQMAELTPAEMVEPRVPTATDKENVASDNTAKAKSDLPNVDLLVDSNPKYSSLPEFKAGDKVPYLMVVFEVTVAAEAIENRVFERILEKYGIVYSDDLVLDENQIQSLESSQWLGKSNGTEEKIGVMFVRSTAKNLDLALQEIIDDMVDFPDFGLNMVADNSTKLMVEQLSTVQVAGSPAGYAGRLQHPSARGNASPFTSSSSVTPMKKEARKKFKAPIASMLPDHQQMSNTLILLRPAKK